MNLQPLPKISTHRLVLKLLEPSEAPIMVRFRIENRDHLRKWEPGRSPEFFTNAYWQMQLRAAIREYRSGINMCLVILNTAESEVLGVCNYTNIIRGTFQSCHLGYALAERHQGKGIMFESLQLSTQYVFKELELHRIMANYMPRNQRSGNLLCHLGFETEGKARSFLNINGVWEDHILTSLINPNCITGF